MARSERQEAGTRGGAGILTRPGTRLRPEQARTGGTEAGAGQQTRDPRRGRRRPVPPQPQGPARQAAGGRRPEPGASPADRRDQRVPSQRSAAPRLDGEQRASGGRRKGDKRGAGPRAVALPARPGPWRRAVPPQAPPVERGGGPRRSRVTGPRPSAAPVQPDRAQPDRAQPDQVPGAAAPGKAPAPAAAGAHGRRRMPFVLLLCGLLGGALVCALVISTTLAEGSFQITNLQASTSSLAKQRLSLEQEVAQAQSPQRIGQRASQLGMRRVSELRFLDLTTGAVTNDGPTWSGALNAPGYAP